MGEGVGAGSAGEGPLIVGLGGATRAESSTERLLRHTLVLCGEMGARTKLIGSADLNIPTYTPEQPERSPAATALVDALREADGLIIATPAYHGAPSGLIKTALDYAEDLRNAPRPYLDGRAVGCLVTAGGWQGGGGSLVSLREIVHALRGWPTPLGLVVNTSEPVFANAIGGGAGDAPAAADLNERLRIMADQVVGFAKMRAASR